VKNPLNDKAVGLGEKASGAGKIKHSERSGAVIALTLGLLGLGLSRMGWLRVQMDVFSAFTVQFAILVFAAIVGLCLSRFKTTATSLLFLLGMVVYGLWPQWTTEGETPVPSNTKRLRVGTFNIDYAPTSTEKLVASLQKLDADVVVLTEYDATWPGLDAALARVYPHLLPCEASPACDTAILSRFPLKAQQGFILQDDLGAVAARLDADFGNLLIVGVHTTRFPHIAKQFRQTHGLSERLAREAGPMIVAGDFNATSQSRLVQDFARSLELSPQSLLPTFPSSMGLPQIAIDQILVRNGIIGLGPAASGDNAGSDHFPIARSFAIPLN
jgi:endonuclease/exonuclease/phosphatase (EEP) superfamily protein YafD